MKMPRKAFEVTVELDIQAVTCPGVWLCPGGKVTLRVFMLGSAAKTVKKAPVFPLLYHEKFLFRKTIDSARFLTDLQRVFSKELLYAELIQGSAEKNGTVLATFETSLEELLYPSPSERGLIAGVDVDLLMEPAKCFPGILSPKIEVSTKTTIEEVLNPTVTSETIALINPKLLSSKYSSHNQNRRQKKVCHSRSRRYSARLRGRPCQTKHLQEQRPPFVVRHVDEAIQDPIPCYPGNRCRRARCQQCSLVPHQAWRAQSELESCPLAPPFYREESPSAPPIWTATPRKGALFSPYHCSAPPRECSATPRECSATPRECSPCGRWYCDTIPSPSVPPPSHRRSFQEETADLLDRLKPYDKCCPNRLTKAPGCRCAARDHMARKCVACTTYKKSFEVCKVCYYPIIPTKRHPQGCRCKSPTFPPPDDLKKAESDEFLYPAVSRTKAVKSTYSDTLHDNGMDASIQCRRYPLLSCNEHTCDTTCNTCISNPYRTSKSVDRLSHLCHNSCKPSYREAFYNTLERFYKKLYKRAKSRASEEAI